MKARIPLSNKQKKDIMPELEMYAKRAIEEERNNLTRRLFKVMLVALHEEFGFGKVKLARALIKMVETIQKSDTDEVYWEHIDRLLIDKYKMKFERDYTSRGKVVNK